MISSKGARRIINVSNRLPIKIKAEAGRLTYQPSEGGLATGLSSLFERYEHRWVGWPGAVVADDEKAAVAAELERRKLAPVFLTETEINDYYEGFCNETIW